MTSRIINDVPPLRLPHNGDNRNDSSSFYTGAAPQEQQDYDYYFVKFVDNIGRQGWENGTVKISSIEFLSQAYTYWENPIDAIRPHNSVDGRIDNAEGLLAIPDVNTDRFMKGFDKDFRDVIIHSELRDMSETRHYGVLSLYTLLTRNNYNEFLSCSSEVSRLGEWAIIIIDKNEFIKRIHNAIMRRALMSKQVGHMAIGFVEYGDAWNCSTNINHIFHKRLQFEWQREFRIVFRASKNEKTIAYPSTLILQLSSLHDIIKVVKTADLINKQINVKPESPLKRKLWHDYGYANCNCTLKCNPIKFKAMVKIG